jgi:hypothetical protein
MLSLLGYPNKTWLHVSFEHVLDLFHKGFAKLMYHVLGFFIANSGH